MIRCLLFGLLILGISLLAYFVSISFDDTVTSHTITPYSCNVYHYEIDRHDYSVLLIMTACEIANMNKCVNIDERFYPSRKLPFTQNKNNIIVPCWQELSCSNICFDWLFDEPSGLSLTTLIAIMGLVAMIIIAFSIILFSVHSMRNCFIVTIGRNYDNCSICLNQIETLDIAGKLKCGHIFHHECISEWTDINNICPNCRQEIT